MTQLVVSDVRVDFGPTTLLKGVKFTVSAGERWGIVGRNGSGKTTLMRLITGAIEPTSGSISRHGNPKVSLLEQHRTFPPGTTVWAAAAGSFADLLALEESLAHQAHALEHDSSESKLEKYGRDLERFEREGGYLIAPRVDAVLHGLGFDPDAARHTPIAQLSGGEVGRVALARQLVTPADILLLDEPTNHLDVETTLWLEGHIRELPSTVLLISHDRAFLAAVVDHVLHVESGTTAAYTGGYEAFVAQRTERRLAQQRSFEQQSKVIAKEADYIARNLAGQNTRQAKGRRKRLNRLPRLSPPPGESAAMAVRFTSGERGPDRVVIAEKVAVKVEDRTLLRDFSATAMRGEIVGLVGPNGTGKTTLLRTLMGDREPAAGELRIGSGVRAAYYRQDLAQVPLDNTIYGAIADLRPMWERRMVQGHLGRFGFSGGEVERVVGTLSGGERARLALAMLTLGTANLLVFDEPTNHLDVESIEALEDALSDYEGTVLMVSHDRELLRALTTRLWVLHNEHISDFPGPYGEWEVVSKERQHAAAVIAAEDEALRRVKERKTVGARAKPEREQRAAARKLNAEIQEQEARIADLEGRISTITTDLSDPELYAAADGVERAARLGAELDRLRAELDRVLEAWTVSTDARESLDGGSE